MNLNSLLQSVGSVGPFSSRVFLPALLTALLLRFGPDMPIIHHLGLLALVPHNQPTWFTSNICLIVLGALSVLELLAQKNPEARRLLGEFDVYLKPIMAALTSLGYLRSTDVGFVSSTVHQAGIVGNIYPLISALLTYRLALMRKQVALAVFDHLDGTHLDHLLSWLEDAWSLFGTLILILLPALMLLMLGAVTGVLFLIRRQLKTNEENSRISCPGCGRSIYPCALACPGCKQANPSPRDIGFLGQSKPFPTLDPADHAYRLVEKRRCPVCAAHRPPRKPLQPCQDCGSTMATGREFADTYADYISQRVPIVLSVCFLLSLVPILGLIASAVYSRMELVLPFSQYLPLGKNFVLRWGIRVLFILLAVLQIIPLLGGLVGPLMAYISYVVYRNAYVSLLNENVATPASPA